MRTPIRMPIRKPTQTTEKPKIRKPAVVIGTSVSSSVSVSSSSGRAEKKEEDASSKQILENMTMAERFKRHRQRLFRDRKRYY